MKTLDYPYALLTERIFFISLLALLLGSLIIGFNGSLLFLSIAYLLNTFIVISTGHQAVHYCFFKSKKLNKSVYQFSFTLMGIDPTLWKSRHIKDHHIHPNSQGHEASLESSVLMRLSSYTKKRWYHKYQHIYSIFLLSFGGFILIFFQDLINLINEDKKNIFSFILRKMIWLFTWVILPYFLLDLNSSYFIFLIVGIGLSVWAFLPIGATHLFEETEFYSKMDDTVNFKQRQLETTIDFSINSLWARLFYGGLNLHRAHHFYPKVASSHLPLLNNKIYKKYDLKCTHNFIDIYTEYFRFLKVMGT